MFLTVTLYIVDVVKLHLLIAGSSPTLAWRYFRTSQRSTLRPSVLCCRCQYMIKINRKHMLRNMPHTCTWVLTYTWIHTHSQFVYTQRKSRTEHVILISKATHTGSNPYRTDYLQHEPSLISLQPSKIHIQTVFWCHPENKVGFRGIVIHSYVFCDLKILVPAVFLCRNALLTLSSFFFFFMCY